MHEGAAAPSYSIRSGGMYAARSGPSGRFLYHFPAVTEGDRKMMQLGKMKISFFRRVLTLSTPRRGRSPFISSPRPRPAPGRGFGSQTTFANLQPRKARPSKSAEPALRFKVGSPLGFQVGFADRDGKIEDFDAAPLERPKWPLPLSFSFSPQPRLRRAGVPVLRGPLGRPRTSSRVNAASDRPSPKVTREGGR